MAKKKKPDFQIKSKAGAAAKPAPVNVSAIPDREDNFIGVNLKYYQRSHECFSKWGPKPLKSFSAFIEKMSKRTESQITSTTKTCHAHKGASKKIPANVSPDKKMYGLDVGSGERVHGFFEGNNFYLVWLDVKHKLHDKK